MLADEVDYVIGVDTHRDQHMVAVVAASTGALVAQASVRANRQGYGAAIRFAGRHAPGVRVWAVEGAGHYGAGWRAFQPIAVKRSRGRPHSRAERRLHGKDDPLDATRAARSALATNRPTMPRSGQRQEALRVLLLDATQRRRRAPGRARPAAQRDRHRARKASRGAAAAAARGTAPTLQPLPSLERAHTRPARDVLVLRSLAQRIQTATHEADTLEREILAHVRALAPELLDEPGVGPIVAAQLIVSWSHHDRVSSEACLRTPRRRRTTARLKRAHDTPPPQPRRRPPTQPRPPHHHPPPPPTRPGHHATTSPAASPKAKPPATPSGSSSATSPATSTASCRTRTPLMT